MQEVIKLPIEDVELNVLDRISAFVLFAGRYPIPIECGGDESAARARWRKTSPWLFHR